MTGSFYESPWRRERDSNPRRLSPYRFSRAASSTTPASLRMSISIPAPPYRQLKEVFKHARKWYHKSTYKEIIMAEESSRLDPLPTQNQPIPVSETPSSAPQPAAPNSPTNGLAIAALVVGIVAAVSWFIPIWGLLVGAAAIVLGILGVRKATGKGMAIAGIITGGFGALLGLIITALFVVGIIASSNVNTSARRALENQQNESQSAIDGKREFSKGETATIAGKFELKVNSVERNYAPNPSRTPAPGKEFVLVNVTVKSISEEGERIGAYSFGVINNGLKTPGSIATVPSPLQTGELEPGASTSGNLIFEVPTDATDLKLAYEAMLVDKSFKSQRVTYTLAF